MKRYLVDVLLQIIGLAAMGAWPWSRKKSSYGSGIVLALAAAGAFVFFDGFSLGVREESRMRYGRVVSGVVEGLRRSDDFGAYEDICRLLLTRSTDQWIVDYSYPCTGATGMCRGHESVSRDLWQSLNIGQSISVRQSVDEKTTARLDQNPQRGLAIVKTAIACVLLALAGVLSGHFTLFQRPKYVEVDGVVTSVERVQYGNETRWKVRFAYFDANGNSQDSIDEVNDPSWKSGDDCRAVYRPRTPDLATLRPRSFGSDPDPAARSQQPEAT